MKHTIRRLSFKVGIKYRKMVSRFRARLPKHSVVLSRLPQHKKLLILVAFFISVGCVGWFLMRNGAAAETVTLTQNDYLDGIAEYGSVKIGSSGLSLQDGLVGSWDSTTGYAIQKPPSLSFGPTNLVYGPNDTLYMTTTYRGQCYFNRYDLEKQVWHMLRTPPVGCSTGTILVFDGNNSMYYAPGGAAVAPSARFFKYTISSDTWQELQSVGAPISDVSSGIFVSQASHQYVYMFRGLGSTSLWRYSVRDNLWETMDPFPTTASVDNGIVLAWDGATTLYALLNSSNTLKKYNITTNAWSDIPSTTIPNYNYYDKYDMRYIGGKLYVSRMNIVTKVVSLLTYDCATGVWLVALPPPVAGMRYVSRASLAYDGAKYVYMFTSRGLEPQINRYDTTDGNWNSGSLVAGGSLIDTHSALAYDGDNKAYYFGNNTYVTGGGETYTNIFRYDFTTKQEVQIGTRTDSATTNYPSSVYYQNALYMFLDSSKTFLKYDIATNTMSTLTTTLPATPSTVNGASIIDGGDGYLYAQFGGSQTFFYRYNVNAKTWQPLNSITSGVGAGGGMTRIERKIYVLTGGQTNNFLQYDMDSGVWTSLNNLPVGGVDSTSFITSDTTRYIYAGIGSQARTTDRLLYRYDTTTSTWQRLADLPADKKIRASALYNTTQNKLYVSQGNTSVALWNWSPGSTQYARSGTWYSKTYDLKQVEAWTSLDYTQTGTGSVVVETRTSTDGVVWSAWQQVANHSIASPRYRYLQLKVTLGGNALSTPTVSNFAIHHTTEKTPPRDPLTFYAYDKQGGTVLSDSATTYEYQHPHFSWSGADDYENGSGVAGYYVYFGSKSNGDPISEGSYQTTQDYTVTSPMTPGTVYYMRLSVKDNLGNTSDPRTRFSYPYRYLPTATILKTSTNDFSQGSNTNVVIEDGTMKLRNLTNGTWSTGALTMPSDPVRASAQKIVGDYLYMARGNNTNTFSRYNTISQTWEPLAPVPGLVGVGSSIVNGGGILYLIAGNSTNAFYAYNIDKNEWSTLPNLPTSMGYGADSAYIGDGKIAILAAPVREFYIYTISTGQYTSRSAYLSTINYGGGGIWYDGADTIYAYLGGQGTDVYGTGRAAMAAYSIKDDTWKRLSAPPTLAGYVQNNLVSDGRGSLYTITNYTLNNIRRYYMTRYDIATDSWTEIPGFMLETFWGSLASDGQRYIYILPGADSYTTESRRMVRYDTWENVFTPTAFGVQSSAVRAWSASDVTTAVYDGSTYVYAIGGGYESGPGWSQFIKFDPLTGATVYLPSPPLIGVGGSLGYINNKLYYLPAKSSKYFYWFDEANAQWRRMADIPIVAYLPGATSLIAAGGALYTVVGNSNKYYRYTPDTSVGSWTEMTSAPGPIVNGASVYDAENNAIYVVPGSSVNKMYRYNIGSNTWTTQSDMPASSTYGVTATIAGGQIFVQIGNRLKTSYIYTIATNSWRTGDDAPATFYYGSVAVKISDTYALVISGSYSPDIWKFIYPTDTRNQTATPRAFQGSATHISQPIVTAGLFDYADITVQATIPDGTAIEVWTRSSSDAVTWNDWSIADNVKRYSSSLSGRVTSPPKTNLQIKLVLRSDDNISTPIIDSYALQYYFDVEPPTNPKNIVAYTDDTKTTVLKNSTWYNYTQPVFDWPNAGEPDGAADGDLGSKVAGYWVYIGTSSDASPRTEGTFITASQYQPTLTTPGNYYVRIQTQDMTGNISSVVYSAFVYRFDNQAPPNPTLVTVTPSGFTTRNNFTFEWPNTYDPNSGVAGYCYHTGATSGVFALETCQQGTKLENVSTAYKPGTNVFYVRSYDAAGNYASSYTTVSFYYSTDPPSPVMDLQPIPRYSTKNWFSFVWDLPAVFAGDPTRLQYCYSINTLPTASNTTCTSERYIESFKAATQTMTNTIYIATRDESGNINWNDYASTNFIADTISPGIPLNIVVTDTSDRVSNRWSLTATWDTPTFAGNGIASYIVERSLDGHTFTEIGNTSTRAFVDLDVQPEMTYYYRVRAADGVDNRGGPSAIVSRSPQGSFATPPQIVVQPTVDADFDQARIGWATSRESTSFVYYGTSPTNLGQSKGSLQLVSDHHETITGLEPSTTYYFRVQSFDNMRNYQLIDAFSPIYSFKTSESARTYDVTVSGQATDSALLTWHTSLPTKSRVEYGPTVGYGFIAEDESDDYSTTHSLKLSRLESGMLYHFRLASSTEFGSQILSDDYTFSTIARPIINAIQFQPIDTGSMSAVIVSWRTNVPTSSTVRYDALGNTLESTLSELTTNHEVKLSGLSSDTEYTFLLEGRDQYGNLASSAAQHWRSGVDTRAPDVSDTSLSVSVTDTSKGKRAQLIAMWKTDEPATSQIVYGQGNDTQLDLKTPIDTEPTTSHVMIISDLNLADIYKIQLVSRDLNGNTVYSPTTTVVTPDKETNIFDNILGLMERLFRL